MEGHGIRDRATMGLEGWASEEACMVQEDRWKEIRRLRDEEDLPIAEIAQRLKTERKTVRRWLKEDAWRPTSARRRLTRCWPHMPTICGNECRG